MDVDELIESGEGDEDGEEQGCGKFRISNSQPAVRAIMDGEEDTASEDLLLFRVKDSLGSDESTHLRGGEGSCRQQKCESVPGEDSLESSGSGLRGKQRRQSIGEFRIQNSQNSVESLKEIEVGNSQNSFESLKGIELGGERNRGFKVRDSIGSVSSIEEFEGEEGQLRESTARGSQASIESVEEVDGEQGDREPGMDLQGSYRKLFPRSITDKAFGKATALRKLRVPLKQISRKNASPRTSKGIDAADIGLAPSLEQIGGGRETLERLESTSRKRWSASEDEIIESLESDDDFLQGRNSAGSSRSPGPLPTSPSALWANFRQALRCAPPVAETAEVAGGTPWHETASLSDRLDIALRRLREQREQFGKMLTNGSPTLSQCLIVQIQEKKLDAAQLTTCLCKVLQPSQGHESTAEVTDVRSSETASIDVIFSSKLCPELELEVGGVLRIHPPWQEIPGNTQSRKIVLGTYFCTMER